LRSPRCHVDKTRCPLLRRAAGKDCGGPDVVLGSDGARSEHEAFVATERLGGFPYALTTALGVAHQVGKLPFAVLLGADGVVRAKGLVNTREHPESLVAGSERRGGAVQGCLHRRAAP